MRDSKSPQRPRDETAFWPAFAPHPLRWLRHYSAFATPLREWLDGVRDALCISLSRLRACAPSALRVYARAHTYAGLPASRFALPWPAAKEGTPDALFEAWRDLPDTQRNPLEAELRQIFDMSCEKGWLAILDEARWQFGVETEEFAAFSDQLSALSSHYARAMITFLDYRACWKGATRFYHADMLSYWRKRRNLPRQRAAVDAASLRELASLISHYFRHAEGRGQHCVVEPYRRNDLDYFFAFPEDHSQQAAEWVNGEFHPRPHNPAFEIVYVYSQQDGTLDLNYRGGRQAVEPLQGIFAQAILKLDELPSDPKDERVYDLNPLRTAGLSVRLRSLERHTRVSP